MEDLNKRFYEIFRDMNTLKSFLVSCTKSKDERLAELAKRALMETRSTYEWQHQFSKEHSDATKH